MIAVMDARSTREDVAGVVRLLDSMGTRSCVLRSAGRPIVELLSIGAGFDRTALESAAKVESVHERADALLVEEGAAEGHKHEVEIGCGRRVGGRHIALFAGPCSVEDGEELRQLAGELAAAGATALRGGAFKPRTSPYSFQGHGERGLEMLARAREHSGLPVVTEVMCIEQIELVSSYADVLQVGSRNMANTSLLVELGKQRRPVFLKRGSSATLEEFLLAAEYVLQGGNENVILCERGIRTHERYVRNTLALAAVPELAHRSNTPVVVDPSHGTGHRHLVIPMASAGIASGADGIMVEVHPEPDRAWTDGQQSLTVEQFRELVTRGKRVAEAVDRSFGA